MEKENEWIEKKVDCGNCDNGKVRAYVEWIPGKRCRISVICMVCDGEGKHRIWIPKFCQMPDCVNETFNKCSGHYCHENGWVCEAHWVDWQMGWHNPCCVTCFHEIGWSGN